MKVVFLDFDGVLNSPTYLTTLKPGAIKIDPRAVTRVNRLLRETGAEVVVSSTWRNSRKREQLQDTLEKCGFTGTVRGMTPKQAFAVGSGGIIETAQYRGQEIQAWLDAAPDYGLDIESYVIVDDGADMGQLIDRLVKTSFDNGLVDADVDLAIDVLQKPIPLITIPTAEAIIQFTR